MCSNLKELKPLLESAGGHQLMMETDRDWSSFQLVQLGQKKNALLGLKPQNEKPTSGSCRFYRETDNDSHPSSNLILLNYKNKYNY